MFTEPVGDGNVKCSLCPHLCTLKKGQTGICGVRKNINGTIYSLNSNKIAAIHTDPIEKKPLYHFLPGSYSLSIAAMGCNLTCNFCQNHTISVVRNGSEIKGDNISPEEIVNGAINSGSSSISYTYTEPTIYFELMYETAIKAKENGIKNIMVSNGFISENAMMKIIPVMDGANIDLKSFSDDFYRKQCGGKLTPVLKTIELINDSDCWIELTTLLIPDLNTEMGEIENIISFIKKTNPEIPWHISRFFPYYKTKNINPTNTEFMEEVLKLAEDSGIRYVYGGNFESSGWGNTRCPECGSTIIKRDGYNVTITGMEKGKCKHCGKSIYGVWN